MTAQTFCELFGDGKSKSSAFGIEFVSVFVDHPEHLEQELDVSLCNSHSCIFHAQNKASYIFSTFVFEQSEFGRHANTSLRCKLERVRNQVHQNLFDSADVGAECLGKHTIWDIHIESNLFPTSLVFEDVGDFVHHVSDTKVSFVEGEHTSFHLCQIEDVFCQTQQQFGRNLPDF